MQVEITNEEQKKSLWKAGGWHTTAMFQLSTEERAAVTVNLLSQQIPLTSFYSGPKRKWQTFNENVTIGKFLDLCCDSKGVGYISLFANQAAEARDNEKHLVDLMTLVKHRVLNNAAPEESAKRYEI